jgi:oligosaccharyltransferase complex subunit gamma
VCFFFFVGIENTIERPLLSSGPRTDVHLCASAATCGLEADATVMAPGVVRVPCRLDVARLAALTFFPPPSPFQARRARSPFLTSLPLTPSPSIPHTTTTNTQAIAKLTALRDAAPDRVIPFTEDLFNTFAAAPAPRPYTLAFFLTASHMMDKPKLGLRVMRKEWGRLAGALAEAEPARLDVASTKKGGTPPPPVFLASLEFGDARDVFARLGATSLPWIVALRPGVAAPPEGGPLKLEAADVMRHEAYGAKHWAAADFATFLKDRAPGAASWVPSPPPPPSLAGPLTGLALLAAAAAGARPAWRLYNSPLAANTGLQAAAALAVWWFAVSGGLYNIIRGMPLVAPGRNGRTRIFLDRGGQLGAEGFIMGSLYTSVGLAAAALTHVVPRVSPAQRRVAGFGVLALMWFAYTRVASIHAWKTGVAWQTFLL